MNTYPVLKRRFLSFLLTLIGFIAMHTAATAQSWNITGNSGTTPGTHFLGTTDKKSLTLKVYNTRIGFFDTTNSISYQNSTCTNYYSVASGFQTLASGWGSTATGNLTIAAGGQSTATGNIDSAYGFGSFAGGSQSRANGDLSFSMGNQNRAYGWASFASGNQTYASGPQSTAMGNATTASGFGSFAAGSLTTAGYDEAVALGYQTQAYGLRALAMGDNVSAPSYTEVALGAYNTVYTATGVATNHSTDRVFSIGIGTSSGNRKNGLTMLKSGNFGLGTDAPAHILEVNGSVGFTNLTTSDTSTAKPLAIASDGTVYRLTSWLGSGGGGASTLQQVTGNGNTTTDNIFLNGGALGIGTATVPGGYLLAVNGTAIFEKIRVKVYNEWPDYVFGDHYNLPALANVETYIKTNKHLPDVPSAEAMKKQGINVADNQAVLLKKIEELTLYIIEQDKQAKDQHQQISSLNAKVESQNEQLKQLQQEVGQLKQLLQTR